MALNMDAGEPVRERVFLGNSEMARRMRACEWSTRSREAAIDHHLVKPVDLGTLERVLAEVASRSSEPASGDLRRKDPPVAARH